MPPPEPIVPPTPPLPPELVEPPVEPPLPLLVLDPPRPEALLPPSSLAAQPAPIMPTRPIPTKRVNVWPKLIVHPSRADFVANKEGPTRPLCSLDRGEKCRRPVRHSPV